MTEILGRCVVFFQYVLLEKIVEFPPTDRNELICASTGALNNDFHR